MLEEFSPFMEKIIQDVKKNYDSYGAQIFSGTGE